MEENLTQLAECEELVMMYSSNHVVKNKLYILEIFYQELSLCGALTAVIILTIKNFFKNMTKIGQMNFRPEFQDKFWNNSLNKWNA